jgi:hypothetical protein
MLASLSIFDIDRTYYAARVDAGRGGVLINHPFKLDNYKALRRVRAQSTNRF